MDQRDFSRYKIKHAQRVVIMVIQPTVNIVEIHETLTEVGHCSHFYTVEVDILYFNNIFKFSKFCILYILTSVELVMFVK